VEKEVQVFSSLLTFFAQRRFFSLSLLLLLQSPSVFAESEQLGTIHVRAKNNQEAHSTPSSFTTVIRSESFNKKSSSLADVLKEQASITVSNLGSEGQLSTVSLRGSSSEQVLILLDGIKLNSTLTGSVDLSSIPLSNVERIEILRGGQSAIYGSDAVGGVINIITKTADAKKQESEASVTAGSFSTLKIAASTQTKNLLLSGSHFSSAGDYTFFTSSTNLVGGARGGGKTFTREHNRSIQENFLTKLTLPLSSKDKLVFLNDFFLADREIPGTEDETTLLAPANALEASEQIYRNNTSFEYQRDDFFHPSLSAKLGINNSFYDDTFIDPSPAIGNPINVNYSSDTLTPHFEVSKTNETKHASSLSQASYNYEFTRSEDSSPLAGATLAGTNIRHVHSLSLQESIKTLQEKLQFFPALRVENASDRKTKVVWKFGALAQVSSHVSLKANASTSHRYPSFYELYLPDQGYIRGNSSLLDEEAFSWDALAKFEYALKKYSASTTFSYFEQHIDNSILFVPISATTIQPVNTLAATTRGVELEQNFFISSFLDLGANYTWMKSTFNSNAAHLPARPTHSFNAKLNAHFGKFHPYASVFYKGKYYINTANTVAISGRTLLDLGLTFKQKKWFTNLEAKDITNVQSYDARGFPLPRRSFWLKVGVKS